MTALSKVTRSGSLLGVAILATTVLGSTSASAYECKNGHHYQTGIGVHPSQGTAMAIATASWTNKVKETYGLPWSVWQISKGQALTCTPSGNGTKTCVARARPCKYVTG